MNKARYTILSTIAHSRRAARFLKPLPIAALAALLAAPAAWAAGCNGDGQHFDDVGGMDACLGKNGNNGNTITVTSNYTLASGGVSNMGGDPPTFAGVDKTGIVRGNTLTIASGGKALIAVGGMALGSMTTATGNTLIVEGTVEDGIGGSSDNGNATGNTVRLKKGGVVTGTLTGGITNSSGDATGNFVTLAGGTVQRDVVGGRCAAPTCSTCNELKDNTLTVTDTGSSIAGKVENFEKLVFTLPATIAAGQPMLTLGGAANFSTIKNVSLTVDDALALHEGDTITLMQATGSGAITPPTSITLPMTVTGGSYTFKLDYNATNKALTATVAPPGHRQRRR